MSDTVRVAPSALAPDEVAVPPSPGGGGTLQAGTSRRRAAGGTSARLVPVTVLLPFGAFVCLFLLWPMFTVVQRAFLPDGRFTLETMQRAVTGPYRRSFLLSARLSLLSSLIGGVGGLSLALALRGVVRPRWLRSLVDGWAAVASQMGGIPLAFAFVATLGTQGLLTKLLLGLGWDLEASGFDITGFSGWVLVYCYFQLPLMFLVVGPAVDGIRRTWEEAAASMGASRTRFWVSVGMPILMPSVLAGFVLLFVNAFSAYATAYALSSGAGELVPLQIRFVLQGNVISGEEDLGYALVCWTVLLLVVALAVISVLQRRAGRWSQR